MRSMIAAVALLAAACSSAQERQDEQVMDRIERHVQLPQGSRPMGEYARYYASDDLGRVLATYTDFPPMGRSNLRPGERRWLSHSRYLPDHIGGGCSVVHIVYTPATGTLGEPSCNGGRGRPD